MVATPYTKFMTAIMDVDMAAAVLVATEARADALGVPPDKRVYLRGTGSAEEPRHHGHPARPLAIAGHAVRPWSSALGRHSADEVAHLDLYSCFASSLSFACRRPGHAATDRQLTVTGGLPYHGGPGSNYTTHALAAMVEVLRRDPGSLGLVTGIGMHMTSHAAALLSTRPGEPGSAAGAERPTPPSARPVPRGHHGRRTRPGGGVVDQPTAARARSGPPSSAS